MSANKRKSTKALSARPETAVLFKTASSLNGRVLNQTACDLQMATIVQP